jgi:hypothetical protein
VESGLLAQAFMTKKDFHEGLAWIDKVLEDDRSVHKKQRHMAHRIFERLRAEEGFSGGYAIVREYVARATLRAGEMFVPLSHRPGHAQADFGQADAYFAGKKVRFHYFCMDLPHSDGCFVKAYPAETADDVYPLIADLIRAERTQRLDRLSLQHLVIAMPYTTQFNNAYYFGIKLPRLAFIKGRGCEATEV